LRLQKRAGVDSGERRRTAAGHDVGCGSAIGNDVPSVIGNPEKAGPMRP
jgi:hypothetical protein